MSKIQIENPKVFISYAWGSKEYQNKVLALATDLVEDGIDVLLDKWSLKEGNDTYAFMEQSVSDETVTHVLILLDPQYAEKADKRSGGVGTETQIISAEVYNKVKQEKFLSVVFERKIDGDIPKPKYLKSLLHFDLSIEENYDEEYQRLVKTLYGIEIYKKPKLEKRPAWLETTTSNINTKIRTTYDVLKTNLPDIVKKEKFNFFLTGIKEKILEYNKDETSIENSLEKYLELYSETIAIRDEFLSLMLNASYIEGGEKLVASKLEEICEALEERKGYNVEIRKSLLHEIFIYIIAIYYKNKNYAAVSYLLTKTYFVSGRYDDCAQSVYVFYYYNENLDNAVNKRDNQKYHSGTANFWISNINTEICSKQDFVFADVLCYNASIFSENYLDSWEWFPMTYVYGGYQNKYLRNFANKMKSIEHLSDTAKIFGYDKVEKFKEKFIDKETLYKNGTLRPYRYGGCFESAPILCQYVKSEDLGIYK